MKGTLGLIVLFFLFFFTTLTIIGIGSAIVYKPVAETAVTAHLQNSQKADPYGDLVEAQNETVQRDRRWLVGIVLFVGIGILLFAVAQMLLASATFMGKASGLMRAWARRAVHATQQQPDPPPYLPPYPYPQQPSPQQLPPEEDGWI